MRAAGFFNDLVLCADAVILSNILKVCQKEF
jgi:hypothetical protein